MTDNNDGEDAYMQMLNNPMINPPHATKPQMTKESKLKPASFPIVQEARDLLTSAAKNIYLESESDEPFEWINTKTTKTTLPTSIDELDDLDLLNGDEENHLKIKSYHEFLQDERYRPIKESLDKLKEKVDQESKVYLVGRNSITVLILTIVHHEQEHAIVGLKSLLVQT